jgi:O-antigen ligase
MSGAVAKGVSWHSSPVSEWIVCAFLFSMPFQQAARISAFSSSAVRYLALAAAAACLGDIVVRARLHISAVVIRLLVFMALVLLSCIWSIDPVASRTEVVSMGGYLMTALAIAVTPRTVMAEGRLARAAVFGGVAASVLVLVGSFAQDGLVRVTLVGAASSADPNNFAASLLLPLALAASGGNARWPLRVLVCGVLVAGILATGSRGGIIGVLTVLSVVLNWRRKGKAVLWGVLEMLIVMFVVWVLVVTLFPMLLTRLSFADMGAGRLGIWRVGLTAFGRFGSIGAGTGAFPAAYDAVGAGVEGYSRAAHNIFLQIAVELGVVGLVLFCLCVISSLRSAKSNRGAVAAILGVLATSFFLGTLELSFFWVVLAFPFLGNDTSGIRPEIPGNWRGPPGRGVTV